MFRIQNKIRAFLLSVFLYGDTMHLTSPHMMKAASEDHSMDRPGEKLRRARERLKLTYRDVAWIFTKCCGGMEFRWNPPQTHYESGTA